MLDRNYYVNVWLKGIDRIEEYLNYELNETDLTDEEKEFRIMAIKNEMIEREDLL